ncbi:ferrochelatase [Parabacteroides sp. FAFU027]|uniref:ferrochelatase n=1 Tax=Parabacteroides sp. FAFU027 TaxID=2922715 RepID=UPI001FB02664|nr:ferrochelatase [Parabacteroides sp. FAFU027]
MSKGALLINLGSPDSPTPHDVKRYLGEFLMDKYVIDIPYIARKLLVKGIILRTRPEKSARNYQKIWWDEGSPLIVLSKRMLQKVSKQTSIPAALAMRYGEPSILTGLKELAGKGVDEVLIIPLYPQYAMATTVTILEKARILQKKYFPEMKLSSLPAFYHRPEYIRALADSIRKSTAEKEIEHFLFSYHGIPERHIHKSDITHSHCKIDGSCCRMPSPAHEFCYRHQCYETTRLVCEELELSVDNVSTSFQSRLGKEVWLQPYTSETIRKLAESGVKKLAVVTPAFVADCLETLEEIGMEAKTDFLQLGGEEFLAIPCLNDNDVWCMVLSEWIEKWAE